MTWIRDSKAYILNKPAVRHRITNELTLCGRYGEVWQYSPSSYSIRVWSIKVANKINRHLNLTDSLNTGDELVLNNLSLDKTLSLLRFLSIPKSRSSQISYLQENS